MSSGKSAKGKEENAMELYIKNKWVSLGGSSTVQDAEGNDVFLVKGKVFSFTGKKTLTDPQGEVRYIIRNKFWHFLAYRGFILDPQENVVATIKRKAFSLHDSFTITSSLGEIQIIGNILEFNYRVTLNGNEIGHVARKISLRDSYVLTVESGIDPAFMAALVIAIDNINDRKKSDAVN